MAHAVAVTPEPLRCCICTHARAVVVMAWPVGAGLGELQSLAVRNQRYLDSGDFLRRFLRQLRYWTCVLDHCGDVCEVLGVEQLCVSRDVFVLAIPRRQVCECVASRRASVFLVVALVHCCPLLSLLHDVLIVAVGPSRVGWATVCCVVLGRWCRH